MSKIVNLRRARKQRTRDAEQVQADQNAAKFGRSKAQKSLEDAEASKAVRHLDLQKREPKT